MSKQFLPLLLLLANPATANSELTDIAIGVGTGEAGVNATRAALVQTIEPFWFGHLFPQLTLQMEYGANRWQDNASTHYAYSLLPNIRWNWQPSAPWQWFTELGVGVSYLEETVIDHQHLGSHWQFEDRLGIGVSHERWRWVLRGYHYSNGGFHTPNDGLNLVNFEVEWRLP